jgi:thiol-disulfide isomerase/thioredoxin
MKVVSEMISLHKRYIMKLFTPNIYFFLVLLTPVVSHAQGYQITATVEGIKDTSLVLGYYFNKQMLVKDTVQVDASGTGTFKGEEALPGGIYVMYLPDKTYFDVLISKDQNFTLTTKAGDFIHATKIKGAPESESFLDYQRFLVLQQQKAQELQKKMQSLDKESKEYQQIIEQLKSIDQNVKKRMRSTMEDNEGSFLATFIRAVQDIKVPDYSEIPQDAANRDSIVQSKKYYYYKSHYFDNMDLNDPRLLRTPIFTDKLEQYFTKTLHQIPDTLIKAANWLVGQSSNDEMRKYLIQYLFNMANDSKVMGMDAMLVNMAENYYLSGQASWADSTFLSELQERVLKMKPNLIGNTAPDLKLFAIDNQVFRLSEIRAPLTVIIFWEPECGHCEKEIPKLKQLVWDQYQHHGIKIFAVYTQLDKVPWEEFIETHDLFEWMNVYDPTMRSNFRNLYDIYSTPVIYVLDENKKIIAKRISSEQLPGFIDHYLKLNN